MPEFLGVELANYFTNPLAFWGILSIVPVLLLYLLRPKPKVVAIPSLMFVKKIEKSRRLQSFFNRLVHDPLLLLQLLMLVVLVFALAGPYATNWEESNPVEDIVIIVDASASMQAREDDGVRFTQALDITDEIVSRLDEQDTVAVVLAESIPLTAVAPSNPLRVRQKLANLKAADTPTNLGDSIVYAKDLLATAPGSRTIYVLSDFAGDSATEAELAKAIARANGITVKFIQIGSPATRNLAITSAAATRSITDSNRIIVSATVTNFADAPIDAELSVTVYERQLATETRQLDAGEEAFFYYQLGVGREELPLVVSVTPGGDMTADDHAYLVVPALAHHRILLLTASGADRYLRYVLESSPTNDVDIAYPPILPPLAGYDLIVIGSVPEDNLLPGTIRTLHEHVAAGTNLVILASDDLESLTEGPLSSLLPVALEGTNTLDLPLRKDIEHEILTDVSLKNIVVKKHYQAMPKENATSLLHAANASVMATWRVKKGTVVYMGVNPDPSWSNFYQSSSYPVFWTKLIDVVNRDENAPTDYSLMTGELLTLREPFNITTPTAGVVERMSLLADKTGFYRIALTDAPRQVGVSLLSERESDLTPGSIEEDVGVVDVIVDDLEHVTRDYYWILAVFGLLLVYIESRLYLTRGML